MKNWKYIEGAKTGNGILDILKSEKPIKMKSSKGAIVTIHPDGSAAHQEKEGSQMAVHHYNSFKEAVEYYKNQGYVKVGNDTPLEYARRKPKVINDDKTGAEEFFKQLSDDVKEREKKDDADIEKVGNNFGNTLLSWSEKALIAKGQYEDAKRPAEKQYIKSYAQKDMQFLKNNISKVKDDAELKDIQKAIDIYQRIGNKVGNATPNYRYKDFLITNPEGHEYIVFLKDGRTVGYRGTTSKAQAEDWCDWHDPKTGKSIGNKVGNSKVGNEAQDDKFAYVMREFDEGKLKTPDGKVVTDPAHAKAIAYSESKKTENGLARARNAMAGNGLLDTVLSKTKHIKRFGIGSKVRAEGETGTVVKETVEVGPNGIPFGWVTVKFSDGKTRQYYDYDLKK